MTRPAFEGKVVALVGSGTPLDRSIAVAFAEAGASVALATTERVQEQEFAMASIANEVWAIGREQLTRVLDATEPTDVAGFEAEVVDRMGRCDILICSHHTLSRVPAEELSAEDWEDVLARNLTAPFLACQAFGRAMERDNRGAIVLISYERDDGDAAYSAAHAGLTGLAKALIGPLGRRGIQVSLVLADPGDVSGSMSRILEAAVERPA